MNFATFRSRALTTLIGLQQGDGSWYGDLATTVSMLDALSEECGGPDPVCRFSGVHAHLHPESAPKDWLLRFSWGLDPRNQEPGAAVVAAIYRGLQYGRSALYDDVRLNSGRAWIVSKWVRLNVLTDTDFQFHLDMDELERFKTDEPWLQALIGQSTLHQNAYLWGYNGQSGLKRPDIELRAQRLLDTLHQDHWQSRNISPEETTALVGAFLFHECTRCICADLKLGEACERVAHWLMAKQAPDGSWVDSAHVTSHCLRWLEGLLAGAQDAHLQARCKQSIQSAIGYLCSSAVLHAWTALRGYQHADILATLMRCAKRQELREVMEALELDDAVYAPDVFISYGSPDVAFARRLAIDLETHGLRVWFAEWDLDYGDDIVQSIEAGLVATTKFVIVMSADAIKRPWVKKELSTAFHQALKGRGKLIVPLMYRPCDPPPFLDGERHVDFTDESFYSHAVQDLARRLKGERPPRR